MQNLTSSFANEALAQPREFYYALLGLFVVCCYAAMPSRRTGKPLPGPKGWPIIGNLFDVPIVSPWIALGEMAKTYGPIFSFRVFAANIVVIDDPDIANTLLDVRGSKYSDRRPARFIDYATDDLGLIFMRKGERFKRMRTAAQSALSMKVVEDYQPIQLGEAKNMILGLVQNPENHDGYAKRFAAAVALGVLYALPSVEVTKSMVAHINHVVERMVMNSMIGYHLVDFLPFFDYFPTWMSPWKQKARKVFEEDNHLFHSMVNDVKTGMANGTRGPSYTSHLLEGQKTNKLTPDEIAWVTGIMFAGGSDTTASSLSMIIRALILNPEVQRKAQAEIDTVVGHGRLPTFADRDSLPYINAIILEGQRFSPVIPIILHATSEDDEYNGYFIPKGSMIWVNVVSIHRGHKYAPDPDVYRPERFLNEQGHLVSSRQHGFAGFGFGRRICPGRFMANASLFINVVHLLWAFNFNKAKDENGNEIDIDPNASHGAGSSIGPVPYRCTITPRIPNIEEMIRQA